MQELSEQDGGAHGHAAVRLRDDLDECLEQPASHEGRQHERHVVVHQVSSRLRDVPQ